MIVCELVRDCLCDGCNDHEDHEPERCWTIRTTFPVAFEVSRGNRKIRFAPFTLAYDDFNNLMDKAGYSFASYDYVDGEAEIGFRDTPTMEAAITRLQDAGLLQKEGDKEVRA